MSQACAVDAAACAAESGKRGKRIDAGDQVGRGAPGVALTETFSPVPALGPAGVSPNVTWP
jgi:hypothetical protein